MLSQVATPDECLRCGACCAHFRVSFYWAEAEVIDEHLVEPLTPVYSCMRGTNQPEPRCQALTGEIGKEVGCIPSMLYVVLPVERCGLLMSNVIRLV